MPRLFPALDIHWDQPPDLEDPVALLLAELDDEPPNAVEERDDATRLFFASTGARDRVAARLARRNDLHASPIEVPDEDWAARSQASLKPVQVGRLIIAPPWDAAGAPGADLQATVQIVIQPSMGFGTGHHATTRLVLRLLQDLPTQGASVLDVGTGSGVLAIAAARLGAGRVLAIDNDPDALASARENVALNGVGDRVTLTQLEAGRREPHAPGAEHRFAIALANLTGATIARHAADLAAALAPQGTLIVSGYELHECDDITRALTAMGLARTRELDENGWVASTWSYLTDVGAGLQPGARPRD